MAGWDWTLVGETALAIALGISAGGWFVVDRLEVAMLRIAGHPSIRKLANAADRFQGGDTGGWPGLIKWGLNVLTGGKFGDGAQGGAGYAAKALVVDTQGNVIGETELSKVRRT